MKRWGIKKYQWQLKNSHGAVKCSIKTDEAENLHADLWMRTTPWGLPEGAGQTGKNWDSYESNINIYN